MDGMQEFANYHGLDAENRAGEVLLANPPEPGLGTDDLEDSIGISEDDNKQVVREKLTAAMADPEVIKKISRSLLDSECDDMLRSDISLTRQNMTTDEFNDELEHTKGLLRRTLEWLDT